MVVAADHDEHVPAVQLRPQRWDPDPSMSSGYSSLMYSSVLVANASISAATLVLASAIAAATVSASCCLPLATIWSPAYRVSPSRRTNCPSVHPVEHLGADVVDQRDARLDQQLRPAVRDTGR